MKTDLKEVFQILTIAALLIPTIFVLYGIISHGTLLSPLPLILLFAAGLFSVPLTIRWGKNK